MDTENLMTPKLIDWKIKLILYKTLIRPILTFGSEAWTTTDNDEDLLWIFKQNVFRKIYVSIWNVDGTYGGSGWIMNSTK